MLNLAKYGALGLVGGTVAGAAIGKPQTPKGEHATNKFETALGISALTATPYLVKELAKANPIATAKAEYKVAKGIEKVTEFVKKATDTAAGKKVISKAKAIFNKAINTKIGKNIVANKTVKNIATKIAEGLKKFSESTKIAKGKYALIAAGVGLLAYAGYKTITNYYKKEGAIDQKYQDVLVMNNYLL